MEDIPQDPFMLMSFLNMKLRDQYDSLDVLCDDLQLDKQVLVQKLSAVGFDYDVDNNKFW